MSDLITERAVIGMFYDSLAQGDLGWINEVALKTTSDQDEEKYAWLGMSPAMRKWVGGRQVNKLPEQSFKIKNEDHEATIEFALRELRRDKTGQVQLRIAELADRANSYPARLLTTLIENGESTTCYDGQYFFDTDHSEGTSGTQDNDLVYSAATGTTPTVDEMRGAILQSVQAILGFKDDRGEPVNETAKQFGVMVPMTYWRQAIEAVALPTVSTGGANLLQNLPQNLNIVVRPNPRLSWTTKMATFRLDGRLKPFILQEELPVTMSAVGAGSELEFNEKKHRYGVDWAGNVGYGDWKRACLTTFT